MVPLDKFLLLCHDGSQTINDQIPIFSCPPFTYYKQDFISYRIAAKIFYHGRYGIDAHGASGSIKASTPYQVTSNKWTETYVTIQMVVSMGFPDWSVKHSKKNELFCKPLTICGSIWNPLLIYQLVLILI